MRGHSAITLYILFEADCIVEECFQHGALQKWVRAHLLTYSLNQNVFFFFFFLFEREQCIHVHTVLFLNRYLLQDRGLIIDTPCTHEYSKLFSSISTTGFCFTYYCPVVIAKLTVIWFIWLCNFISVHFTLQELGKWKVGTADAFTSMKF
jgi:hypothetical protein